jgi:hypothetical protein
MGGGLKGRCIAFAMADGLAAAIARLPFCHEPA